MYQGKTFIEARYFGNILSIKAPCSYDGPAQLPFVVHLLLEKDQSFGSYNFNYSFIILLPTELFRTNHAPDTSP
jgi:hypothetical protein